MIEFYTLREFLLLRNPTDNRSVFAGVAILDSKINGPRPESYAEDLVRRYDIARASWEKYGDNGPPVGSKVETLVAGHGGGAGCVRRFDGIYERDKRFFVLSRIETGSNEGRISLVEMAVWFVEIQPIE